jgi:chemotaxis protein MotC
MIGRFVLCAGALFVACSASTAQQRREPYEIVRALQASQNDLVRDTAQRQRDRDALAAEFNVAAASADAGVWADRRNRRALIGYILRGGSTGRGATQAASARTSELERALLDGAIAVGEARLADAARVLKPIDPRRAPLEVGGLLALTLARLEGGDRAAAMRRLDMARLLSPGTLIEEAALRQQVFLASDPLDVRRFSFLALRYVSRFSGTAFYQNFFHRFRSSFIRAWLDLDGERRGPLDAALHAFSPAERSDLLLQIAKEALKTGKRSSCLAAIQRLREQDSGPPLEAQITLLEAAADVVSDRSDRTAATLHSLDPNRLGAEDRALRDGALMVAAFIRAGARPAVNGHGERSEAMKAIAARIEAASAPPGGEK